MTADAAAAWNAEYSSGRYAGEPAVGFVDDIVAAAKAAGVAGSPGVYIGCGNGRNYVPLVAAGLDLLGLDISPVALGQLAERVPEYRDRLVLGSLSSLVPGVTYGLVIGIQVFQHGNRAQAHELIETALDLVAPAGLLAVRVNAVGTDVEHAHEVTERHPDGSYSVLYTQGPKAGLTVHFWAANELHSVISRKVPAAVLPLRPQATWRQPAHRGLWMQWEGIYAHGTREPVGTKLNASSSSAWPARARATLMPGVP
jgi:SAM-dependent methyltransferase